MYSSSKETTDGLKVDADEQTAAFAKVREESGLLRDSMMGLVGMVGIGGVAFGLKDLVKGGQALQAQQVQLQAALRATGQAGGDAAGHLKDYAESLSTKGGFATTQNLSALTAFVRETHSVTEAQTLLTLSTNVARGRSIDLASAQMMVQRAYTGSVGKLQAVLGPMVAAREAQVGLTVSHQQQIAALQNQAALMGKLGPIWLRQQEINDHLTAQQTALAQMTDKHATAMQVLAAATQEFGGATAAYANTTAGKVSNLKNSFQNLTEELGAALLPAVNDIVGVMAKFGEFLTHHKTVVVDVALAVAGLTAAWGGMKIVKGVTGMLSDLGKMFGIVQVEGEESAMGLTIAWDTFMTATIVGLVLVGLVEMIEHWKQVEAIAIDVWHGIESGAVAAWHGIEHVATMIYHALTSAFTSAWNFIKVHTPLGGLIAGGIDLLHGNIGGAASSALRGATFGLLSSGGVVKPHYYDMGGPVGTDTVPGWLSPGEGVVNAQGMAALGAGGLSARELGAGAAVRHDPRAAALRESSSDTRVLTQSVIQQILNLGARGPSTLTGGSLVTGAPGLPV